MRHANFVRFAFILAVILAVSATPSWSQSTQAVPPLIHFTGVLRDSSGTAMTGTIGITLSLYKDQEGGAPLWLETQNVTADKTGHYSVQLGATSANGLPFDLFASGEARWLGVQPQGQPEQPRVMLLSVPYAMKAGDAATIGGLPPSAFVLAAPPTSTALASSTTTTANTGSVQPATSSNVTTSGGTANSLPLFTTATNIQNSAITQAGSGATAKIGINTATPASALDVAGGTTVRGTLTSPATGTATATKGFTSQPQDFVASVFNSGTSTPVAQKFQWQAEPTGNNTTGATGTMNLLYASGVASPAETGLKISNKGLFTFATGQTFPGTGTITGITTAAGSGLTGGGTGGTLSLKLLGTCAANQILKWNGTAWACAADANSGGTVTSVASGAGLTGGPITSVGTLSIANAGVTNGMLQNSTMNVNAGTALTGGGAVALGGSTTINLDTTKVPLLTAANTFTGNQTVNGNLSATGVVTGSGFQIGSNLFAFGSFANSNAFLGFAGNTTTTGVQNTAEGLSALAANTDGGFNTAIGFQALTANTTGGYNTAQGQFALTGNITGIGNTSDGYAAIGTNTIGQGNTAVGYFAGIPTGSAALTGSADTFLGTLVASGSGGLNNATAIGYRAEVDQSNSLVLGSINGVNGCSSSSTCTDTNVGIGTTSPQTTLHVVGNSTYQPLFVDSASTFGTWMQLRNLSTGGKPWAILSAGSGNSEGAGNLGITDFGQGGTIILEANVQVNGTLSKSSGSFKIDDPLDPANKYLYHSFVESPDMMNIYNGVITLDARGGAWITMPKYFEALNRDFRYQLTAMGRPQPSLYIAREMSGSRFRIAGGKPGGRVSWQVTGIRHDAYADAHRIPTEEDKPLNERGKYLHPELFGASAEQQVGALTPAATQPAKALIAKGTH